MTEAYSDNDLILIKAKDKEEDQPLYPEYIRVFKKLAANPKEQEEHLLYIT